MLKITYKRLEIPNGCCTYTVHYDDGRKFSGKCSEDCIGSITGERMILEQAAYLMDN